MGSAVEDAGVVVIAAEGEAVSELFDEGSSGFVESAMAKVSSCCARVSFVY